MSLIPQVGGTVELISGLGKLGLRVISKNEFLFDVAAGLIPGFSLKTFFGVKTDIPVGIRTEITNSDNLFTFPLTASTLTITSDNVNDDIAGTGAQKLKITGLDVNFLDLTEEIDLDGVTPVVTTSSFRRFFSAETTQSGTNGANEGTLKINLSGTNVLKVEPNCNKSFAGTFTIPSNKQAQVISFDTSILQSFRAPGERQAQITYATGLQQANGAVLFVPMETFTMESSGNNRFDAKPANPELLPAKTEIKWFVLAHQDNTKITISTTILLRDL